MIASNSFGQSNLRKFVDLNCRVEMKGAFFFVPINCPEGRVCCD
jgi:hypothetical protein